MKTYRMLAVVGVLVGGATAGQAQQPTWGTPQREHCIDMGLRQHSARLWNISGSWEVACDTTPATVGGQFFAKPTRCRNMGWFGMWGQFDVSDSTCPRWGVFQDDGCIGVGTRQMSAVLHEVPSTLSAAFACPRTGTTLRGQSFSGPSRCVDTGLFGMWGQFDVSDNSCSNPDVVQFSGAVPSTSVAIVLDGETTGRRAFVDQAFMMQADNSGTATFDVGPIVRSPASNEVIAFSPFTAPTHVETPWSIARDTFGVQLDDRVEVPVTMWILSGPPASQQATAALAVGRCGGIWASERTGLRFGTIVFRDATANALVGSYLAFPFASPATADTLKRDIGFDPSRLNVYWVDTVNGGSGNGVAIDGQPVVLVGRNASGGLLCHELGHAFVLEHVDPTSFDANNVMIPSGNSRQFFTEGQVFRMHFHPSSAINYLYNARPGRIVRVCAASTSDSSCVANNKRLWPDGTLPPN